MSWTLSRRKAYWFAEKDPIDFGTQSGAIWSAIIEPGAVLGVFDNNGEKELVVDPAMLRDVRLVETLPLRDDAIRNFEACQAMRDRGEI